MNIKVDVNSDEVVYGEDLILVLQDQEILKGNEINEENDILENIQIREKDKLEFRKSQQEKMKLKHKGYADKFEDDDGQKRLLSHYDEQKMEKEGFLLDENGIIVESMAQQLENISNKLKKSKPGLNLFFEDKIASDYLPAAGQQGFKKRKLNKSTVLNIELETAIPGGRIESEESKVNPPQQNQDLLDDQLQLQRSLEEKMRLNIISQSKARVKDQQDEQVKQLILLNSRLEAETIKKQDEEFSKPKPKPKHQARVDDKDQEEIKVLSSATDFLKNIKTDMELQENSLRISAPTPFSIRDTKDGTTSILNVSLPTERFLSQSRLMQNLVANDQEVRTYLEAEEQQELKKAEDELAFLEDDKHGPGLASTLKNVRERGLLKEQKQEYIGRSKDSRGPDEIQGKEKKEIVLEYRNDKGKLMTPKEAFRYQCHIFHGKRPSKNKIEKQLRKQMHLEKIKQLTPGQTPLMKALATEQQKSNQAYMVISSKKNFD